MTVPGKDTDDTGPDTKYPWDGLCFPGTSSTKGSKQQEGTSLKCWGLLHIAMAGSLTSLKLDKHKHHVTSRGHLVLFWIIWMALENGNISGRKKLRSLNSQPGLSA